jgi:hypothetical protein
VSVSRKLTLAGPDQPRLSENVYGIAIHPRSFHQQIFPGYPEGRRAAITSASRLTRAIDLAYVVGPRSENHEWGPRGMWGVGGVAARGPGLTAGALLRNARPQIN